jgi:hypothetical protein
MSRRDNFQIIAEVLIDAICSDANRIERLHHAGHKFTDTLINLKREWQAKCDALAYLRNNNMVALSEHEVERLDIHGTPLTREQLKELRTGKPR